ncbi:MAG: hypothetical protein LBE47_00930 [Methanomassiliicoccaceae archaeon]|nr:hypothetical protein [Methanomassiliicoccaceae archaeon]
MRKKAFVLMIAMVALMIPVLALSESAAAADEKWLDNTSIHARGFNDRSDGTVTVKVYNVGLLAREVTVYVGERDNPDSRYASAVIQFQDGEEYKFVDLRFRMGSGTHYATVFVTDSAGAELWRMSFDFDSGRSIWSNTWTYVAIILVIVIIGIAAFLKMRGAPKVDNAGAYTAMEEERRATKKSAGRQEYKGREERKSKRK